MKKKVKVLSLIWSMNTGGAQQVLINYLRDFQDDDDIEFKVCVYTRPTKSKYDKEIIEKGYNVKYLNNPQSVVRIPYIKRWFNLHVAQNAWKREIEVFKPDIVHVHISLLLVAVMPGIVANNIPVRFDTLHSSPYRYKGKEKKIISNAFQKNGFIPICITKEQVDSAEKCYGITNFEVVRNGVDLKSIIDRCISKEESRKLFNIPNDKFVVLGVGRLNPVKNFMLLIDAFVEICKKGENAMLIFAGEGNEKQKLIQSAKRQGVLDKVMFVGNVDNVVSLYCAADVLAVTSISESSSLVAIEAQSCGLRCVLSDGVPEESIVSKNSKKIKAEATPREWADALLDTTYKGKAVCSLGDYEVHNVSKRMKSIYLKYYEEKMR